MAWHNKTGRFRGKRTDERLYLISNFGEVENKLHFLCVCNTYFNFSENMYSIVNNSNIFSISKGFSNKDYIGWVSQK